MSETRPGQDRHLRLSRGLLLLVVLAAFALRLYRLDFQDIWWDEARNIDVASRPLAQIAIAPELDIHPAIYFYLLHGWRGLAGGSAFAARFLSLWFGVLLIPLMDALGRRIEGRWTGFGAALAAAFLPFLVGEAQETRMYTVGLVWVAAAALALVAHIRRSISARRSNAGLQGGSPPRRAEAVFMFWRLRARQFAAAWPWVIFALFSALALLTHYAAVFAVVPLWCCAVGWSLIGSGRERRLRATRVALAGLLTAVLCLPGLPVALRQIPSYRNPNLTAPTLTAYLSELGRVYGLGEHIDPIAAQPWVIAGVALLLGGWVLALGAWGQGAGGSNQETVCSENRPAGHCERSLRSNLPVNEGDCFVAKDAPRNDIFIPRGAAAGMGDCVSILQDCPENRRPPLRSRGFSRFLPPTTKPAKASSPPRVFFIPRGAGRGKGNCPENEPPAARRLVGLRTPGAAYRALRTTHYALRPTSYAFLLLSILPPILYYLVILDRAIFASRYISFALPGWLLLIGLALAGWAKVARRLNAGRGLAGLAAWGLVIVLLPGLYGDLTDARFFREDTRGLVAWLKTATRASDSAGQDLILVDQRYPFGFYYERWNNQHDGFPPAGPADLAPAQYLFVDINAVADRLNDLTQAVWGSGRGLRRIFWVHWFESDTDPRGAAPFLLEKFGARLGERSFRGYTVTWYAVGPVEAATDGGQGDAAIRFELAPPLTCREIGFGEQVRLIGAAFGGRGSGATSAIAQTRLPIAPTDKAVWAVVRWARLPRAATSLKATLVLEDAAGFIVGRDDRPILNDRHLAPPHWTDADQPLSVFLIRPLSGVPPGRHTLKLTVYDPATLQPLAVQGGSATISQVELTPAVEPPTPDQVAPAAAIDAAWRGLRLLGCGPLPETASPGSSVPLELYWQAERAPTADWRVRLALAPPDPSAAADRGSLISLDETVPTGGRYPPSAWRAGEVVREQRLWRLDPTTPAGRYRILLTLVDPDAGLASPPSELGEIAIAGRLHVFEPPAPMRRSAALFGDFARLMGHDLAMPDAARRELTLTLYWRAERASAVGYAVTAQLLDANGVLRGQRDQTPGDAAAPTTSWLPGEYLTDVYRIELPAGLPAGDYTVIVAMYDPVTLARLPVADPDGKSLGDALLVTQLAIGR